MRLHTTLASLMLIGTFALTGCGALCTVDTQEERGAPGGRYSVSVETADCAGQSRAKRVVMHNLGGLFKDSAAVAIYDDSDPDNPTEVSVHWELDRKLIIHGHGAHVWSFQPYWHSVHIEQR